MMDSHKLVVKLFVQDPSSLDVHEFVPVFHSWIQERSVPDHLLIDVSDYSHVHHGPGVLLVTHEANFYTDQSEGRPGLMYARKQPVVGTFRDRLRQAFVTVLEGCKRLEGDPRLSGRIKFRTDELLLSIHDRLKAPSTLETFQALRDEMTGFFSDCYGGEIALRQVGTDETPFRVELVAKHAPPIDALLNRLTNAAAVG